MRAKSKTKIHVVEVSSASWRSAQGKAELTREALEVFTPPDARPNHAIVARTLCNSIVARTDVAARVHFSEPTLRTLLSVMCRDCASLLACAGGHLASFMYTPFSSLTHMLSRALREALC